MDLEIKRLQVANFKVTSDASGTFTGHAAVFDNLDFNGDVIEPGAFAKTLATAYKTRAQNRAAYLYPLLWQHDETEPIGGITDASEDSTGLAISGQYDVSTVRGAQAYSGAKKGYLTGLSIGYRTVNSMLGSDGNRHLLEITLFEASPVTFPANAEAQITSVKTRRSGTHRADRADLSYAEAVQRIVHKTALMALEAKAASILHNNPEITVALKRCAEIDAEQAQIRTAIAALSSLPESAELVAKLRTDLAKLEHERAEANHLQAKWRDELRAIRQRYTLERKARARGERVPNLQANPEAYVVWLQRQRALPYIDLARDLNEQNRRGLR